MIPAINLKMRKSDISNFKEYCELRKFYNDLLYSDEESEKIYDTTRSYGVGNFTTCTLCVAAERRRREEDESDKCNFCIWNLVDSHHSYPCVGVFDNCIFDRDSDMKTQLKERIGVMDYLIAEYENMEEY